MQLPNLLRPEKKTLQILAVLLLFSATAVTATTIITGNTQPDGYSLNVTTLQPEVKPTEAVFRANVTKMSSIYDAALVYWNYTNTNTGKTYRSGYNLTLNESTVSTLQPELKAGTNYNVKAYVQPVIWEDQKLLNNTILEIVNNSEDMSQVASSSTARSAIFNGEYPIKEISSQNMFDINGKGYEGPGTFTGDSQNEGNHGSTGYVEIKVNYTGTIHYNISVSSEQVYDYGNLYKNSNRIFHISGSKTRIGTLSVSSGDTIRVEYTKDGSNSYNQDQVIINSLYWTTN